MPCGRPAFRSNRLGSTGDLYQKGVRGSGEDELLLSTPNPKLVNQWSRDGHIVFTEIDPKTKEDLWVLPAGQGAPTETATRKAVKFLKTEFKEFQGQISPDGPWMAYTSGRDTVARGLRAAVSSLRWHMEDLDWPSS